MTTPVRSMRERLKRCFASLMGVPEPVFEREGLAIVPMVVRERPVWANWMIPIWFVAIGRAVVCAVAPAYAEAVRAVFGGRELNSLLRPELLQAGRQMTDPGEWVCQEILFYGRA